MGIVGCPNSPIHKFVDLDDSGHKESSLNAIEGDESRHCIYIETEAFLGELKIRQE
jgi:hypothetical protein